MAPGKESSVVPEPSPSSNAWPASSDSFASSSGPVVQRTSTLNSRKHIKQGTFAVDADDGAIEEEAPISLKDSVKTLPLRNSESLKSRLGSIETWYKVELPALREGAFGQIFRATQNDTQAVYAVKMIPIYEKERDRVFFEKELGISRMLEHPNIIRLHDVIVDEDDRMWHLVMDFCTGGDLFDWMVETGSGASGLVHESTLARYAFEMLNGIKYCHSHHFCHRDIKLENYMLQSKAPDAPLMLIDFGLACEFTPGVPMTVRCGTTHYTAPEIYKKAYNEKVDIWSIGICFYMTCVGRWPFYDADDKKLAEIISSAPVVFDDKPYNCNAEPQWLNVKGDVASMKSFIKDLLQADSSLRPTSRQVLTSNTWLNKARRRNGGTGCCTLL